MHHQSRWIIACAILGGSAFTTSCGPGGAANAVRSDSPTAAGALGGGCSKPGEELEPWIVDMAGDKRGALKAAMDQGVVVVSYDCKQLTMLRGCKVAGNYDYASTGLNEDTLRLEDSDSVKATLSGGAAFAAKLESEMKRGTKLDIGYAIVGESGTTLPPISRDQLRGSCAGATHFIGGASRGAFAMRSSTSAQVSAAAELLGQGGGGDSQSKEAHSASSGKRVACQRTSNDPIPDCDHPVKVRLVPILEPGASRPPPRMATVGAACPGNTQRVGMACITASKAPSHTCRFGDGADCTAQCQKGNPQSCAILGFMYEKAKGVTEDPVKARESYDLACQKREAEGCAGLGYLYSKGQGVAADPRKAQQLFEQSCQAGNGRGCAGLGHQMRLAGDVAGAVQWFDRACKLSYARACFYAGSALTKLNRDPQRAMWNYDRACTGDDLRGCLASASMNPAGGAQLRDRALQALQKDCDAKDSEDCEIIGHYFMGKLDKNVRQLDKGIFYYDKACRGGVGDICLELAQIYEKGEAPIRPDPSKVRQYLEQACDHSEAVACSKIGRTPKVASSPGGRSPAAPTTVSAPSAGSAGSSVRMSSDQCCCEVGSSASVVGQSECAKVRKGRCVKKDRCGR